MDIGSFQSELRKRANEAAEELRDARIKEALDAVGITQDQFRQARAAVAKIEEEFQGACRNVLGNAPGEPLGGEKSPPSYPAPSEGSQAAWIVERLRAESGSIYGPDLYDGGEKRFGKDKRRSIQSTVSRLIREGWIVKGKHEWRKGRHGSHLMLRSEERDPGAR